MLKVLLLLVLLYNLYPKPIQMNQKVSRSLKQKNGEIRFRASFSAPGVVSSLCDDWDTGSIRLNDCTSAIEWACNCLLCRQVWRVCHITRTASSVSMVAAQSAPQTMQPLKGDFTANITTPSSLRRRETTASSTRPQHWSQLVAMQVQNYKTFSNTIRSPL